MAKELLPDHLLNNGKYIVKKALSFNDNGGVYLVADTETEQQLLLKEVIPPRSLPDSEVEIRIQAFGEALLILTQFDHPNLCKIYSHFADGRRQYVAMEKIEGVTLQTLLSMSIKPIPEPQVLNWAVHICEAMHYLHDRPKPFIFDVLDSTHIMIDANGQLKLINFGLDRFIVDENAISFTADRDFVSQEMKRLGSTLAYLLLRKDVGDFGLDSEDGVSEKLTRLLNKLLSGEAERSFDSFEKLGKAFDAILHPPVVVDSKRDDKPLFRLIDFNAIYDKYLTRFLKQPIWLIGTEAVALILVLFLLNGLINPKIVPRQVAAAYIACGRVLTTIDLGTHEVTGRIKLSQYVHSLASAPNSNKLFCSARDEGKVLLLNSCSNRVLGIIPVNKNPRKLVVDPTGHYLYVLHPDDGLISVVELSQKPLPMDAQRGKPLEDAVTAIHQVGAQAKGLVATTANKASVVKTQASANKASQATGTDAANDSITQLVYSSSQVAHSVVAFSFPPVQDLTDAVCQSAGPVALSNDKKTLYAAQLSTSQIYSFKTPELKDGPIMTQTGGSDIRDILVSPDDKELWVVNGTGSIGVIGVEDKKLRSTVKIGATPTAAAWRLTDGDPELWVTTQNPDQVVIVNSSARNIRKKIVLSGAPTGICILPAPAADK